MGKNWQLKTGSCPFAFPRSIVPLKNTITRDRGDRETHLVSPSTLFVLIDLEGIAQPVSRPGLS
jgi:hypothetical protein